MSDEINQLAEQCFPEGMRVNWGQDNTCQVCFATVHAGQSGQTLVPLPAVGSLSQTEGGHVLYHVAVGQALGSLNTGIGHLGEVAHTHEEQNT